MKPLNELIADVTYADDYAFQHGSAFVQKIGPKKAEAILRALDRAGYEICPKRDPLQRDGTNPKAA